ncbi:SIR2 family protein [Leifsonia sp. Root4]|uniref:SIR2 family protein n=1 Tax=Leifsonia sp. Root4 TaxID=1736525 RepID=UPI000ADFF7DF|nr:SIR2 family protein [Leifsonia sp. Root4]
MTSLTTVFDPSVSMAVNVQAQPGVFAVLLGSGVSTGAGIPTGWGVVKDLVRRIATATTPTGAALDTDDEVEEWWAANRPEVHLGYSALLAETGQTAGARRGLLARYFEPDEAELEQGLKVPTAAHRAIAELVKAGYVRVIVTTNFDRLAERALEDVGISPQVISTAEGATGMIPLQHAVATVIKVNGDYAELGMRNTHEELGEYPTGLRKVVKRVFEEYGLIVSGWSAEWDVALTRHAQAARSRRYPVYWDARSSNGEVPSRLLAARGGQRVAASTADELFTALHERVVALESLSEPPVSTAMALARVKRYIANPIRRVDLRDLVMSAVEKTATSAENSPVVFDEIETVDELFSAHFRSAVPSIQILATGAMHGEPAHHDLWVDALQTLIDANRVGPGSYNPALRDLRHYPALLALRAMGIVAIKRSDEALLLRLLQEPRWRVRYGVEGDVLAVNALNPWSVLDADIVQRLERWEGARWKEPQSHLLRAELRAPLSGVVNESEYDELSDGFEYRMALAQHLIGGNGSWRPAGGEFVPDFGWGRGAKLRGEERFLEALSRNPESPWMPLLGEDVESTLSAFRDEFSGRR